MASSVSSERAFSSAGITISKRHNRLKPDVVEALQFLKCAYYHNLIFREEMTANLELEEMEDDIKGEEVNREEERGWDDLVEDLPIDEGFDDDDGDEIYVQTLALFSNEYSKQI
jgi:hypothetical protein